MVGKSSKEMMATMAATTTGVIANNTNMSNNLMKQPAGGKLYCNFYQLSLFR